MWDLYFIFSYVYVDDKWLMSALASALTFDHKSIRYIDGEKNKNQGRKTDVGKIFLSVIFHFIEHCKS